MFKQLIALAVAAPLTVGGVALEQSVENQTNQAVKDLGISDSTLACIKTATSGLSQADTENLVNSVSKNGYDSTSPVQAAIASCVKNDDVLGTTGRQATEILKQIDELQKGN